MNRGIKVESKIIDLIKISWDAIKQRRVLKFPFESNKGNTGVREIKPYMVYINDKEEIRVAGIPREFWSIPADEQKNARHYLLNKIDLKEIKTLSETFTDPGVPRSFVVFTKEVEVICRFIYDDEDIEEVMKTWIKIDGLDF
jgi:hypothetical protein